MSDLGDLRLYVRYDEGSGPVMVLLHGINSDALDWRTVIDTIGGGYRFIAVDLLGFGESPKPTDIEYTADDHAEVLHNTLADIGVTTPFLLVGYSLGGDIAIRYASTYPEQVRRLFLLSAPFYLPPDAFAGEGGFGVQYLSVILFGRLWKLVSNQKRRDTFLYQIINGKAEDFAKGFLRTDDIPTHWDIMSKNLRNCIGKATFVHDLPKLSMPVTFALGIRDPIVHPDQTPQLKRLKPDIDIRRIVGLSADHFLLLNLPDTVAHEIMHDEVSSLAVRWDSGEGDPVVFLHGFADDPSYFKPVAAAVSARHRAVLIDLLGFGESPKPLSSHFTLADHADAVVHTLEKHLHGKPARLVAHGFSGLVALEVARTAPHLVSDIAVFSLLAIAPGATVSTNEPAAATVLALRDRVDETATDPRSRAGLEAAAERVIPLLRSIDNVALAADLDLLLDDLPRPLLCIDPAGTEYVDDTYTHASLSRHPEVEVLRVDAQPALPIDEPAKAAKILDPDLPESATSRATQVKRPKPHAALETTAGVFASLSNQVLLRGLAMFVLGLIVLSLHQVPARAIAVGFAIYVAFEGVTTISGAVGLRRRGKTGWVTWLLLGGLSAVVGVMLLLRPELNIAILGLYIAIRAVYVGAANLYVARRVSQTPTPRWLLIAEGLFGVLLAVALFFGASHGALIIKYALSAYLLVTGWSSIAYAYLSRRAIRRRIRSAVDGDIARAQAAA